jgi:hypothetical protein
MRFAMASPAALSVQSLSDESRPFTLIGRRSNVDVFLREGSPSVELAAVGDILATPEHAHAVLLSHVDPRVIATMAESWISGVAPDATVLRDGLVLPIANDRDFSLSAHWTAASPVGLSFEIADDRGAQTRARNWVDQINGSWGFDPIDEGAATRAIYHVQIVFASPVARWTLRNGALTDLPTLVEQLRSLVGRQSSRPIVAANDR